MEVATSISSTMQQLYDFLTRPSQNVLGYKILPYHGAVFPIVIINIIYLGFVFKIGPWFMQHRKPYNLRTVIFYYNIGQIVYNSVMTSLGIYLFFYKKPVPFSCITPLPIDHPLKYLEVFANLLYLSNKYLDYLETIFFVLRKSYKQVTFLHVYHHILMATACYLHITLYTFGGHPVMIGILNSIVHVFMYTYYLMSTLRPQLKGSIWWKKYITLLQISQFIVLFIHQMWPLMMVTDCAYSKLWCGIAAIQALLMLYLFSSFYFRTYIKKSQKQM